MEQIYTIPVNEAFEASRDDHSLGCPFCALHAKLEADELSLILGASMMEPDIRLKTNEMGFCPKHYGKMLEMGKRLPLALMLESHLNQIHSEMKSGVSSASVATKTKEKLEHISASCYICSRIERNFSAMLETAALLWERDEAFREKCALQPYFCLPHYARFLSAAKERMNKKTFGAFYAVISETMEEYLDKLCGDVSWFCKKFDYRYTEEPWYDSKNAPERAIAFLSASPDIAKAKRENDG